MIWNWLVGTSDVFYGSRNNLNKKTLYLGFGDEMVFGAKRCCVLYSTMVANLVLLHCTFIKKYILFK